MLINKSELVERSAAANLDLLEQIVALNARLPYQPRDFPDCFGNIFIYGLQRSGTTLTSQVVARATDLGYINNLIARFWVSPAHGVYLSRHLGVDRTIAFESAHGATEGISNVHEFGYFWASLFGVDSTPALAAIDVRKVAWDLMRNKLLSINHAFGRPCVYKNTLVGHFLPHLHALLASKLFVFIKRDLLEIAISTLKVRQKRYGDAAHWWSMKPYEYEVIKDLKPHEQIVAQLRCLEADLDKQTALVPRANVLEVRYQDLCADPMGFLEQLQHQAAGLGIDFAVNAKGIKPFAATRLNDRDPDVCKFREILEREPPFPLARAG